MSTTTAALALLVSATVNTSAASTQYKGRMAGSDSLSAHSQYVAPSACKAVTEREMSVAARQNLFRRRRFSQ
jgi:outer membrane lipoprotein-sorting protein